MTPTASSGCLARIGAGLALLAALLAGCATQPPVFPPGPLTGCLVRFEAADRQIRQAGVEDQGFPRVPGFPFLRTSRLLASFSQEPMAPEQFGAMRSPLSEDATSMIPV
ncbi:hypothetical protein [Marinobacterium aestuariivivens]|uniref:Uncharacterized protein n=1 Tax=Marinobacterium aestuariivivens TaxID=1698799 RepID=A0ABW2A6U2_9GAMM